MAINMKPAVNSESSPSKGPSWAKKGAAVSSEVEKIEKEAALAQEQNKRMWRFWLGDGEEARITFIDGDLLPNGQLDTFAYWEHNLMLNGKWGNTFVCTKEIEPCPICEADDKSSFVAAFTVVDHREYKGKDGKIYPPSAKLFIAKRETLKMLGILGAKRGGLAGCTFDVVRSGDKSSSVGSMFDFIEKTPIDDLKAKFQRKNKDGKMETFFVPANYELECSYKNADELRAAIPSLAAVTGNVTGKVSAADAAALENEL